MALTLILFIVLGIVGAKIHLIPYPEFIQYGPESSTIRFSSLLPIYPPNSDPFLKDIFETHRSCLQGGAESRKKDGPIMPVHINQGITNKNPLGTSYHKGAEECQKEGYELLITRQEIRINIECSVGLVRAISTLLQLLDKEEMEIRNIPIRIKDSPRFEHRGVMIDTARHFLQLSTIKRIISGMMLAKLNVLHWHLVDDDTFAMQSRQIPGLAEKASFSPKQIYRIEDIKGIVEYARRHGVRVIPEIDFPGHSRAIGLFQPLNEILTCFNSVWPWKIPDLYRIHGGPPTAALDPSMEKTFEYTENVMKDLLEYFDDNLVHLGGDEVIYKCWKERKSIKEFMKKMHIPDYPHLMNYYILKAREILTRLNPRKTAVYWSDPHTFPINYKDGDVLQYWGSTEHIHKLRELYPRNKFILSPLDVVYLNTGFANKYGVKKPNSNYNTWLKLYLFEPTNFTLPQDQILGAEACVWGEINHDYSLELRMWPRIAALAETLWMAKRTAQVDLVSLVTRLNAFSRRLLQQGIPSNPITKQYCEIHPEECFRKWEEQRNDI